jgi:hypothetical protein
LFNGPTFVGRDAVFTTEQSFIGDVHIHSPLYGQVSLLDDGPDRKVRLYPPKRFDFIGTTHALDRAVRGDEYFAKRLKQYEKRTFAGEHPYRLAVDLLDDIDHWRRSYESESYGLLQQFVARLMVMASINDSQVHTADFDFAVSQEHLSISLSPLSLKNRLESYWINALTYREQKDQRGFQAHLEPILDLESELGRTSYRLFAARELAILQYETDTSTSDIKRSLAIIGAGIEHILVRASGYSFEDYDAVERVITMWAYLDINLKIGEIEAAERFLWLIENKVPLRELLPKLHKEMQSDFYRSLYMYHLIKQDYPKADAYYRKHATFCAEHNLSNSLIWIERIRAKFSSDRPSPLAT